MAESREEERLRQQGEDRQTQQIIELQQRLQQVEEEKNNDAGAATLLRGWIDQGLARQNQDGNVELVGNAGSVNNRRQAQVLPVHNQRKMPRSFSQSQGSNQAQQEGEYHDAVSQESLD